MPNIHLHIDNFNAGELSPLLGSRFEVEKVRNGCRLLRNFIPHVHGPAFRRPGMEFMGAARDAGMKSSLRGFNFSTSTGFILELHPKGLQVWSNGLLVDLQNPVPLPYSEAECAEVQMAQVNDTCYLTHPNHAPRRLWREKDDDWRIEELKWLWPALRDENARSEEIATPTTTVLFTSPCHEWAEFSVPGQTDITVSVANPQPNSPEKTWKFQRFVPGTGWVTLMTRSWTTTPPANKTDQLGTTRDCRIVFIGPSWPASTVTATWSGGSATLDTSVSQPASLRQTTIEPGDWQVRLIAPPTVPKGAKLQVQIFNGTAWAKLRDLTPKAGEIQVWRGPKHEGTRSVRLKWIGRAMSAGTMSIEQVTFPVSKTITVTASDTIGLNRTLTASDDIFVVPHRDTTVDPPVDSKGHVGSYWQIVHRRDSSFVSMTRPAAAGPAGANFTDAETAALRVQGSWEVFTYGIWQATLYLEKRVNGEWEILRSWESKRDRNVIANGTEDQEVELRLRISTGVGETSSLAAVPRFTLEATDARVYGLVKITEVGIFDPGTMQSFANEAARLAATPDSIGQIGYQTDSKVWYSGQELAPGKWIVQPKLAKAKCDILTTIHSVEPTSLWTEGAWSDVNGYPRSVTLHGQRLWFGGTRMEPLRLWGSVVNDFVNFRRSTFDDASVSFTPAAQQANALQWMASFGEDLVLGTSGDEWTLSGGSERGPVTPTSVLMQRRSGYGSRYLPAVLMGEVVTFVQRGGRKVRQVAPRADGIVWSAADLTVLAEHVTRKGIIQMAAMTFPFTILWAVTADGKLLGMTHETEQNVFAWHVHETDGVVESVAVVLGVEADEVWLSVLRNGRRNIERLDPKVFGLRFDELENLCYADGAVKFHLEEPTDTLTGLEHLNDREVVVLGDGAELTPRTVSNGEIVLEHPVSVAVVGLAYESMLQPTRRELNLQDGSAQHRQWKTSSVGVHLYETLACEVADAVDTRFEPVLFRSVSTPLGSAPPLFTGDKEAGVQGRTRGGIDVVVKTAAPLPLNVAGITWKGDVSGE